MLAFSGFLHPFCTFPFKFEFLSKYFYAAIIFILFVMLLSLTSVNVSVYRQCVRCFFFSLSIRLLFHMHIFAQTLRHRIHGNIFASIFSTRFSAKNRILLCKMDVKFIEIVGGGWRNPMKCVECTIIWIWNTNDS